MYIYIPTEKCLMMLKIGKNGEERDTYAAFNECWVPRRWRFNVNDYFFKSIIWTDINVALKTVTITEHVIFHSSKLPVIQHINIHKSKVQVLIMGRNVRVLKNKVTIFCAYIQRIVHFFARQKEVYKSAGIQNHFHTRFMYAPCQLWSQCTQHWLNHCYFIY